MKNICYLTDCMEFMVTVPDKFFDLAMVDPPYGIERFKKEKRINTRVVKNNKPGSNWNNIKPNKKYFKELLRISKFQIIWGMNNFTLPETEYFIVWNKKQTVKNYASAELAWTNIKQPALIFEYSIHKVMQNRKIDKKINSAQKPVALYKWLLQNYAQPDWKIFDSHVGSGSIRIACHDLGFDFTGCEIDRDYWQAQEDRYQNHIAQPECWTPEEIQEIIFSQGEYGFD